MGTARLAFTADDDEELRTLVKTLGDCSWKEIAAGMTCPFNARQCRERWRNYLGPHLGSSSWTDEEDRRLFQEFERCGTHWARIADAFPGRSGNTVRNRYFMLQRKKEKNRRFPGLTGTESDNAKKADDIPCFSMENFRGFEEETLLCIFFPTT
jgi:hypothetical protein